MKALENPYAEIDQIARNLWDKITVLTNTQKFEQKIAIKELTIENLEQAVTTVSLDDPAALHDIKLKIQGPKFVFTLTWEKFAQTIILFDEFTGKGQKRSYEDQRIDFINSKSVLVKKDLFTFKDGSPVKAYKYTNFTNTEKLIKTALSTLPYNEFLQAFSVALINKSKSIVLTGGVDKTR